MWRLKQLYLRNDWFDVSTREWQFALEKGDLFSIARVMFTKKASIEFIYITKKASIEMLKKTHASFISRKHCGLVS